MENHIQEENVGRRRWWEEEEEEEDDDDEDEEVKTCYGARVSIKRGYEEDGDGKS